MTATPRTIKQRQQQQQQQQTSRYQNRLLKKRNRLIPTTATPVLVFSTLLTIQLAWIWYCFICFRSNNIIETTRTTSSTSSDGYLSNRRLNYPTTIENDKPPSLRQQKKNDNNNDIFLQLPHRPPTPNVTLTAYIEPPFHYYHNQSTPPIPPADLPRSTPIGSLITPLPLRTQTPTDLQRQLYPRVTSCSDLPHNLPVDPGFALDPSNASQYLLTTVDNDSPLTPSRRRSLLPHCPVDSDPFLPWIHDVVTLGSAIRVIAQNKRRCNTSQKFFGDLWWLLPQATLLQHVAVTRVREDEVKGNGLWEGEGESVRYRLSSLDDADPDGRQTRFICRFHSGINDDDDAVYYGETLSTYPINYELLNAKKSNPTPDPMLTLRGYDTTSFWLSTLQFDCPLPPKLSSHVASGAAEGRVFFDIVPIRTAPRQTELFVSGLGRDSTSREFDADGAWGGGHVLPRVEASGRWENVPVCKAPLPMGGMREVTEETGDVVTTTTNGESTEKPFYLVGCLWAAASYNTRHNAELHSDTLLRLVEWIEFHLLVGFDHFYIYDNSHAQPPPPPDSPPSDLSPLLSIFGPSRITLVPWPFRACNNNRPNNAARNNDANGGERSSQYAADNSCHVRFGRYAEWMTTFDGDEYFVPMGGHESLRSVLREARRGGTNILNFRSTRPLLNYEHAVPSTSSTCPLPNSTIDTPPCLTSTPTKTYLQTYNCETAHDPQTTPKPSWADRARKQIYRPDHILAHHVHYTPATRNFIPHVVQNKINGRWRERQPSERLADERREAIMVHAKTIAPERTWGWEEACLERGNVMKDGEGEGCWVGFAWPGNEERVEEELARREEGWMYNCWTNEKVDEVWVPRLMEAMERRRESVDRVLGERG